MNFNHPLTMKTLLTLLLLCVPAFAADVPLSVLRDKAIIDTLSTIPVQEAGRLKPLSTLAMYRLQAFHGTKSIYFENPENGGKKEKLSPMEWLLVTWFRPEVSKNMPLFVVDNAAAIVELGLPPKSKRDRYSFNELAPAREAMMNKRKEYAEIEMKLRKPEQRMIVDLASNFLDYEMLSTHFDFVRTPFGVEGASLPPEIATLTPGKPARLSELLPKVIAHIKAHPEAGAPMQNPWLMGLWRSALGGVMSGNPELALRLFPPAKGVEAAWQGPGWIIMDTIKGTPPSEADLKWLASYEDLYLALPDAAKFKTAVQTLATNIDAAASARGSISSIKLEHTYHSFDPFFWAPWYFGFGLALLMLRWIVPGTFMAKLGTIGAWGLALTGVTYGIVGIVMRFLILNGLGPVTNLYETIIYISTVGAIFALVAEALTRRGMALAAGCILGCVALFVAIRFETMEGRDTMQTLQAVLITRFWLLTHVLVINAGYAACMIAAILGMIYMPMRLFGALKAGAEGTRMFTRIAYGFVGAGVLLSLVGTILGGIWANYSWGRFWGWDPKENGALMICLMCLIILHARLGGYIKEVGLHAANIVLGMIVVFSWWGVNQLGVGLHAYGFTDGVWFWLSIFWATQIVLLLLGVVIKLMDRNAKTTSPVALQAKAV